MTEDMTQEELEEAVVSNLDFAISNNADLMAYLGLLNCSTTTFVTNDVEPNWEHIDERIEKIEGSIASFEQDWDVFKENYERLKEEYDA